MAVAVGNIEEHMRVELMDPKWKEEQIRAAEKRKIPMLQMAPVLAKIWLLLRANGKRLERGIIEAGCS